MADIILACIVHSTNPITQIEYRLYPIWREIEATIHLIMHCQLLEAKHLEIFDIVENKFP